MKFREYDNVEPLTISAEGAKALDKEIKRVAQTHDIIDLQFATNTLSHRITQYTLYSALMLVRPLVKQDDN